MNCKNNISFLKNQLKVINLSQKRKLEEHWESKNKFVHQV